MKKIFVVLAAMMLTIGAQAQNQQRDRRGWEPKEQATRQMQRVQEICKTTAEQDSAVYHLFLTQANEMKAMRDSLRATNQEGQRPRMDRSEWQKRQEKTQAALKAILSAEQYEAYDKSIKEMMQTFGQRQRGEHRPVQQ